MKTANSFHERVGRRTLCPPLSSPPSRPSSPWYETFPAFVEFRGFRHPALRCNASTVQRFNDGSFTVSPRLSTPIRANPNVIADNFPMDELRRSEEVDFFPKSCPKKTQKDPNGPKRLPRSTWHMSLATFYFQKPVTKSHRKSQKVTRPAPQFFFQNHVPKGPKRSQKTPKCKPVLPLVVSEMQPSAQDAHFLSAPTVVAKDPF